METDGCSGFQWLEGFFVGVRDCCVIHDGGGTDGALLDCLQATLPGWAWPAAAGCVAIMVLLRPVYVFLKNRRRSR